MKWSEVKWSEVKWSEVGSWLVSDRILSLGVLVQELQSDTIQKFVEDKKTSSDLKW
jgi:hypothetical protein